jgi:hypothetical protein
VTAHTDVFVVTAQVEIRRRPKWQTHRPNRGTTTDGGASKLRPNFPIPQGVGAPPARQSRRQKTELLEPFRRF